MNAQQDKIIIKVDYKNEPNNQYVVSRIEKIKKFLCEQYRLAEKDIAVKIDGITCDSSDSFDKYIKDNQPLKVVIFDIDTLIADYQELQQIREQSSIENNQSQLENTQTKILKSEMSTQYDLSDNNEGKVPYSIISIQQSSQMFSQIIYQNMNCFYCHQDIKQDIISTPCQHFYHPDCFDQFIYNNLQLSSPTLQCLCNQKLQVQILQILGLEKFRTYKETLLENQLFYLQQHYKSKIGRCIDNQHCKFWFFNQFKSQIHKKIICHQCSTPQNQNFQAKKSIFLEGRSIIRSHNAEQRETDMQSRHPLNQNLPQDEENKFNQIDGDNFETNGTTQREIMNSKIIRTQQENNSIIFQKNETPQKSEGQQILNEVQIYAEQVVENQ
ncbi:unnamed protein product (macronuclear) [Paramecium tetraurelia]|uniref:RING-type domain-containing protein n=1 Tax=Paramecium tetraurelia TaxID=5888 RepID=A0C625_PARTE|nr:uncharacterized protein GSPATT00035371001 [Paramecium tetraurelia]CAK66242.1 unnamed protein product [Paramecium tetraurelia]|eukprot:XP_001433639.1 hypothetical protein (macronuclear) [Paramecium tetraurelia strain d4-2]